MRMPVVFVSHGAPNLVLAKDEHATFLGGLAAMIPRPRAILVVSAHWTATDLIISTATRPTTIHDFSGFGPAMDSITYPCPGAPDLAQRCIVELGRAGLSCTTSNRGLDHGAWCPLRLAWPLADVPVTQITVQPDRTGEHALAVGAALAPMRDDGVLILGSGGAVHNLSALSPPNSTAPPWAQAFNAWMMQCVVAGDVSALAHWRQAPGAHQAHPTPEHFLPLVVVAGSGQGESASILHQGWSYGSLAMTACAWGI